VQHPDEGVRAWPLRSDLYVRHKDITPALRQQGFTFRTKREVAAAQLAWLDTWTPASVRSIDVVTDGAYAKRPLLRLRHERPRLTFFSRLPCNAALWSVPPSERKKGQRGPLPTYGKERLDLAQRAEQPGDWQEVTCVQYGQQVTKRIKTFLATWKPAGGVIRVVLVQEADDWLPYFCTKPEATPAEILEAMADRGALEQTFKEVKEVWGAGQQQVRNVYSNEACFNLNLWLYSLVEVWEWEQAEAALVDRSASPWDHEPRRPSHADKRKALQREVLRGEIEEALAGRPSKAKIRALMQRLLDRAA